MITAQDFIKQTTSVPEKFVDELFEFYNQDTLPTDFVINLDPLSQWLNVPKRALIKTLKASYKKDIDYQFYKAVNPNKKGKYGNNYTKYMLTIECFKMVCMLSKAKNADMVRHYFIEVEAMYIKYRQLVMNGMNKEITDLNRKVKDKVKYIGGYIYIIRASDTKNSVYKLGRTVNLTRRLQEYQTGKDAEVELLYKYKTDDIEFVESCVKKLLKEKQLKKYREIYQVDIDIIKTLIRKCDCLQNFKKHYIRRKESAMTGGYYVVIDTNV